MPPTQMIDTHCHLNFDSYDEDRAAVIQRATESGVTRIIIPAVDIVTTQEALALAANHTGIFAAAGVHPNSTADFDKTILAQIEQLAVSPKVIAIGEIGLDYYWDKSPKINQQAAFEAQLELAAKMQMPVIIHNRDASDAVIPILENWVKTLPDTLKERPGVLHSVSAPPDLAERALAAGFYLGFTGPITFSKAEETRTIARHTPLNRILVETDAPFLTPHPYRGKRNEPSYIPYIVERLASVKNIPIDEMARLTTENAMRLFGLG